VAAVFAATLNAHACSSQNLQWPGAGAVAAVFAATMNAAALPEAVRDLPAGLAVGHLLQEGRTVPLDPTQRPAGDGMIDPRWDVPDQDALVRKNQQAQVLGHDHEGPQVEGVFRPGLLHGLEKPNGGLIAPEKRSQRGRRLRGHGTRHWRMDVEDIERFRPEGVWWFGMGALNDGVHVSLCRLKQQGFPDGDAARRALLKTASSLRAR
jgi:hypothetical protein